MLPGNQNSRALEASRVSALRLGHFWTFVGPMVLQATSYAADSRDSTAVTNSQRCAFNSFSMYLEIYNSVFHQSDHCKTSLLRGFFGRVLCPLFQAI